MNPRSKTEWRAWAKSVRSSLPDASEMICAHLERFILDWNAAQSEDWSRIKTIVAYCAFGNEVHLEGLVVAHPEIVWLTTRVNPGKRLTLHDFSSATVKNRFGILEPPTDAPELEPGLVDVALVPGLAFDTAGGRLGYGAGFYDRLLPRLRPGIPIIGVTRDALVVPELPLEDHDVRMTHLATESGVRPVVASPA